MSLSSKLNDVNHLHIRVSPRTNVILINIMTVTLILYSLVGIVFFAGPSMEPWPFLVSYSAWVVIGLLMIAFYRDKPFATVGLYMLVIGVDNLISWYLFVDDVMLYIIQIIPSAWMVVSGILWMRGKVISRYPVIISTLFMMFMNFYQIAYIIENPIVFELIPLNVISAILQFVMYVMLILILACNDTNELTTEEKSLSRTGHDKGS
jgi:hypothetical protein